MVDLNTPVECNIPTFILLVKKSCKLEIVQDKSVIFLMYVLQYPVINLLVTFIF